MPRDEHEEDPDTSQSKLTPDVKRSFLLVAIFSLLYFIGTYAVTVRWYGLGLFADADYFFDADTGTNLKAMSLGGGRYAVSHPLLEVLKAPVLTAGFLISRLSPWTLREASTYVAFGVSPLFASLGLLLLYGTLIRLKLTPKAALVTTVAFGFWSSNLLFASIPETFTISRAFMTGCFFWLLAPVKGRWWNVGLFCIGLAMAGTTITNLAIFFLMVWIARARPESWKKVALIEMGRSILIFGVAIALQTIALSAMRKPRGSEGSADWLRAFLNGDLESVVSNVFNLLTVFTNMLIALQPVQADYGWSFMHDLSGKTVPIVLGALAIVIAIIWSLRKAPPEPEPWRWVRKACLAIIGFNVILHSFFGREMFLYTQHWIVPTALLLVPVLTKAPRITMALTSIIALFNLNFIFGLQPFSAPTGMNPPVSYRDAPEVEG